MKLFWMIITIICFSIISLSAQEKDSLFAVGNNLYLQKNYEKAFQIYDGLVQEGFQDPSLWYNFANVCMQMDEPERALAYYEKAFQIHPKDEEIQSNLKFVRHQLNITDLSESSFFKKMDETYLYAITVLLTWISVLLILVFFVYQKFKKNRIYQLTSILSLMITLFFLFQSGLVYQFRHLKKFAIAQEELLLYKNPAVLSQEVYDVFNGQKVEVIQQSNGWSEIKTDKNKTGWVISEGLIVI
jgi:tetratricopeptide (TPR) repeat protein